MVWEFFPKKFDFPGKRQKLDSFVFNALSKHIMIKLHLEYVSVAELFSRTVSVLI